ncbi:MAG: hypothetical protein IJE08_08640 [Clostridia bacterium]|nr:hypothetical protein [Clostridia bacterium]
MANNPSSRLRFTDEEHVDPALKKPIRKIEKAAVQREIALSKLPTKKTVVREKVTDISTSKPVTKLRFEETVQKPPASIRHPAVDRVNAEADRLISEYEEDNTGLQAAHTAGQAGQFTLRMGESAYHSHQLRQYRKAEKTEEKLDQANRKYLLARAGQENPQHFSNPFSRWQQKRAIQKEYTEIKRGRMQETAFRQGHDPSRHMHPQRKPREKRKTGLLIGAFAVMLVFVMNSVTSCVPVVQTTLSGIIASTYPAEEADILAAEAF